MALSPSQVWEVRTTGSDSNGGGFKAGASGTDYSQQDAAQVVYSDLAIDSTTNIKLTSAANPFASAHVGNVLKITSGTGFTVGRFEVVSVTSGVATMDRAVGTASSTAGVGKLGGAIGTIVELFGSAIVASNKAFIKAGTHTMASAITSGPSVASPSYNTPPTVIQGYYQTRGDITPTSVNQSNRPVIQPGASLNALFNSIGSGYVFSHLIFQRGSNSYNYTFFSVPNTILLNLKVSGFGNTGISYGQNCVVLRCEVTGGLGGSSFAISSNTNGQIRGCYVHDNQCVGINLAGQSVGESNLVVNNIGTSSDGIQLGPNAVAVHNTVYGNGRHGINITTSTFGMQAIRGNILANNGGYGLTCTQGAGLPATYSWDGNAYYNNTSGARNNLDDTTTNTVNGVSPYTNTGNVFLAAGNDPFTNAASGDFSLNNTANRGALLRAASMGNTWPGSATVGYRDLGAVQHQDSGGSVTVFTTFIEG